MHILLDKKKDLKITDLNYQLKRLEKEEWVKPEGSRVEEIIKVRIEINETETDEQKRKSEKAKVYSLKKLVKLRNA